MALSHSNAIDPTRLADFNRRKRKIDLVIVVACLPILVPLLLGLAVLLFLTGQRNPFFRQKRIGYQEQPFSIIKFRTMNDARGTDGALLPDAMRLTRAGKFLRRTSLDELPQVWNILTGDMSIVGPRPLYPHYLPYYSKDEQARHLVRPGITGLAQVSGRNALGWDDRLECDVTYVHAGRLSLDVVIVIKTVMKVLKRNDVVVAPSDAGGRHLSAYRSFPSFGGYRLRPLCLEDLDERARWFSNRDTINYMRIDEGITIESTEQWFRAHLENPRKHDMVVESVHSGLAVAMVGVSDNGERRCESYIVVRPEQRGVGIGKIAQRLLYEWCFTHRGYAEVRSSHHRDNVASLRIHETFGASEIRDTGERILLCATPESFRDALTHLRG